MLIYLDIKIPHLQIAHQGGNLEVGNIKIHHVAQYLKDCQVASLPNWKNQFFKATQKQRIQIE